MGFWALLFVLCPAYALTPPVDWPVFQGSASHRGISREVVPPLKLVWEADMKGAVYSSPVIFGGKIYVATERGEVNCFAEGGEVVWTAALPGRIFASTPSVCAEALYIGAVRGRGLKGGAVYSLEPDSGRLIWDFHPPGDVYSSPLILGKVLVVGCDDGHVYALNRKDGSVAWKFKTGDKVHDNAAAADGNRIFIGSYDGFMYCLEAGSGRQVWRFKTGRRINTAAVFADETVYFGAEDRKLYAVSAAGGKLKWFHEAGDAIVAAPAVSEERVYVAASNGVLRALTRQGKPLWSFKVGRHVVASPVLAGRHVYVGSIDTLGVLDQSLYALDGETGSVVWERGLKGPLFATPAVGLGLMIVVNKKGRIFAFRGRAGKG